jgi:hypothetical protein
MCMMPFGGCPPPFIAWRGRFGVGIIGNLHATDLIRGIDCTVRRKMGPGEGAGGAVTPLVRPH